MFNNHCVNVPIVICCPRGQQMWSVPRNKQCVDENCRMDLQTTEGDAKHNKVFGVPDHAKQTIYMLHFFETPEEPENEAEERMNNITQAPIPLITDKIRSPVRFSSTHFSQGVCSRDFALNKRCPL